MVRSASILPLSRAFNFIDAHHPVDWFVSSTLRKEWYTHAPCNVLLLDMEHVNMHTSHEKQRQQKFTFCWCHCSRMSPQCTSIYPQTLVLNWLCTPCQSILAIDNKSESQYLRQSNATVEHKSMYWLIRAFAELIKRNIKKTIALFCFPTCVESTEKLRSVPCYDMQTLYLK